jgi:hypothetical protein
MNRSAWLGITAASIIFASMASTEASSERFSDICNLTQHAALSKRCEVFLRGVVEVVREQGFQKKTAVNRICVPNSVTPLAVLEKIRPRLRARGDICLGKCNPLSDALIGMQEAYPCH